MTGDVDRKQHTLTRVILVLTAISVASMAVIIVLGLPRIFSSDDNSTAVRRGSDLQSCRSSYASQVTEATTAANDLVLRGLEALGKRDKSDLTMLVTDPPGPARAPIDEARALVRRRSAAYSSAVKLSRTHPSRFLAECSALFDGKPFTSCSAARRAGAAPLHRGDPGYSVALDADRDGLACE